MRRFGRGRAGILVLKIGVTLMCFWYLFQHLNVAELRDTLPGFEFRWAILAVVLLTLQIPLVSLRWLEIARVLKMADRPAYLWMTAAAAIGQFFGQILPLAAGDGLRIWFFTRFGGNWRDAVMSVTIDRCVGVGLLLVLSFAILLFPSSLGLFGGHWDDVIIALGAALLVGVVVLVSGALLLPTSTDRCYVEWVAKFLTSVYHVVFGPRSGAILGIGCVIHLLTIAAVWSLGHAQNVALPLSDAAVLFAVMVGITLVPFSIGGWGLREFAMVSLFGNYGLTPERALLFSMYFGLACVIASLPGAVVWFAYLMQRPSRADRPVI
ncbi:MAG: lysylphosphatidylglycerol synthase transmembrane domain-containing protein [Xanthobacteraceae bacterium]